MPGIRVSPLFNEEAAQHGANLVVDVDHTALTEATDATAQVIPLFDIDALYQSVELVRYELITPFENTAEAGNNTTLFEVGDGGDPDRLLTSTQANRNGTEVYQKAGTGTKFISAAADTIDLAVAAPAAATSLAELNAGKARFFFKLHDSRDGS